MAISSSDLVGGGLPKITDTTAVVITKSRMKDGEIVSQIGTGAGLTPVLNITTKGSISFLVLGSSVNAESTALGTQDQVKITIDGVVTSDASVTMAANRSAFFIGSYGVCRTGVGDAETAVIPFRVGFNTLKVEVDNTSGQAITLFGDPRSIA